LTRSIAGAKTETEICQAGMRALEEIEPDGRASILLFDECGVMRFKAWRGLSEQYRHAVEGHTPWRSDDPAARPFAVPDVRLDAGLAPHREIFEREGIRSLGFVPLTLSNRVLGKFMIYGRTIGDPLAQHWDWYSTIADHVAIAVDRQLFERELMRERRLFFDGPVIVYRRKLSGGWPLDYISPNVAKLLGRAPEALRTGRLHYGELMHPDDLERIIATNTSHIAAGHDSWDLDYRLRRADGRWLHVSDHSIAVRDADGKIVAIAGYVMDVTARRELELELLQARKLESIGLLAGGVAHDFNNLLTVIIGSTEFAADACQPESELGHLLQNIRYAAERASTLTAQLLTFAKRREIAAQVVDVNQLISESVTLLRRTLGEHIELITRLEPNAGHVHADPGQLHQVLANLAVNARDAMAEGGELVIASCRESHSKPGAQHDRVVISVTDSGCGMDNETLEHIFEPFFTTKEPGRGTGLGLATCYGIVQQVGGSIEVHSEVGVGSTFRIVLPRLETTANHAVTAIDPSPLRSTQVARILLCEDDPLVRDLTATVLTREGHDVLVAIDGLEAIELAQRSGQPIELLITDLVMPRLSGRNLAARLRAMIPGLPVIYTTGYDPDGSAKSVELERGARLVLKPYRTQELLRQVYAALELPQTGA
jgi:PAS domain S-box-containing protein